MEGKFVLKVRSENQELDTNSSDDIKITDHPLQGIKGDKGQSGDRGLPGIAGSPGAPGHPGLMVTVL